MLGENVMKTCVKRALQIATLSGGMFFLGAGIAAADTGIDISSDTTINLSIGSDQNSAGLIDLPVTISDVTIDVLADGAESGSGPGPVDAPSASLVDVPVTVSDVDVAVLDGGSRADSINAEPAAEGDSGAV